MTQATATIKAWTTSKWSTIDEAIHMIKQGEEARAVSSLSFTNADMSDMEDWVLVGTAEVKVTLYPREEALAKELDGLNSQLQKVRAENYMRENAILDRISKLQAITYEPSEG